MEENIHKNTLEWKDQNKTTADKSDNTIEKDKPILVKE